MAITFRRIDTFVPTSTGQRGADIVRVTGDASATSVLITLGPESDIKTIRACIVGGGVSSNNIPLAGVAASTGFTLTFGAAPPAVSFDAIIIGDGR